MLNRPQVQTDVQVPQEEPIDPRVRQFADRVRRIEQELQELRQQLEALRRGEQTSGIAS